ncbi:MULTISPECIES: hypothetical protein [unclassified Peribacillus]|uniref:hypothetical protein n=1 Tax=unclassified Peribacillus TaxID=2675266 RepID=UPI0025563DC0|nr:hypothetical protein [Peribacillus sp. SI8-4]
MKMKRSIIILIGLCLFFSTLTMFSTNKVNAEEINNENSAIIDLKLSASEMKLQKQYETRLVEELKNNDSDEYPEVLEEFIKDNESKIAEKLKEENAEDTEAITINDKEVSHKYKVDENTVLNVDANGITLDAFEEGAEREATIEEDSRLEEDSSLEETDEFEYGFLPIITKGIRNTFQVPSAYAASSKTKSASHYRICYSNIGTKLYTAKIAADFTYNGSTVTAQRTTNYIKRHFDGAMYSIYDKASAVTKPSSKKRTAYQSGMVSWGLHIKGVGLVFEEKYIRVNVSSDHNGKISKSSVLE